MGFNSFLVGHEFGPYEVSIDQKASEMYSKAIINRDLENHSPFAIVSTSFGKLLADVDLEDGAIHLNQSISWVKEINEKEMIYAKPIIDSKTERRNNVFIKIRVEYCDKSNKKLGESISTILINLDGE